MTWFGWLLIAWWGVNALLSVALIGYKRQPVSRREAVVSVVVNAFFIIGVILWS